jgi:DNA/RNA-binding protein KIN17
MFAKEENTSISLGKVKYFCTMCSKQCQDKDGFKCHLNSDHHKKNLQIVSKNPEFFINQYSNEFQNGFLDILKRGYQNQFESSNKVYQDYISDRFATHLNATKWTTLTGFVKHLEETGKCELAISEKEIKIKYIDNSPEALHERQIKAKSKKQKELEDRRIEDEYKAISKKIKEESQKQKLNESSTEITEKSLENPSKEDIKNINIEIKAPKKPCINKQEDDSLLKKKTKSKNIEEDHSSIKKRKTEEKIKIDYEEELPWIKNGMLVEIRDKKLGNGRFYKKLAKIIGLTSEYTAQLEVEEENKKVKIIIDQIFLKKV